MTGIIERTILLVPHTYRAGNIYAAARAAELLSQAGIEVRLLDQGRMGPVDEEPALQKLDRAEDGPEAAAGCELVLVLGGDGTFLRAANYAQSRTFPCWESTWATSGSSRNGSRKALTRRSVA